MVDGARADVLAIDASIGVAVTRSVFGRATVTGPRIDQSDPVSFGQVSLTSAVEPALSISATRVPVYASGLAAASIDARDHAGLTLLGGGSASIGQLFLTGAGCVAVEGDSHIARADVSAGRLDVAGGDIDVAAVSGAGELVASGGRLGTVDGASLTGLLAVLGAALDDDVRVDGCDAGATVTLTDSAPRAVALTGCAGRVVLRDLALAGDLDLAGVSGADVSDLSARRVSLGDGARSRLARVVASDGLTRSGTAREQRFVAALGLVPQAGDPDATGRALASADGVSVHVSAAPADALVELLGLADAGRAPSVVAAAFASAGQVLFRHLPADGGPWRIQTTLLDGTTGPAVALDDAAPTTCQGNPAPHEVRDIVAHDVAHTCPGAPADAVASADCKSAVRVVTLGGQTDLTLVDLATGLETRLTDDAAIERSPAFTADGRTLWLARREPGAERWSLARLDLDLGATVDALVLPGDALWPAPSPDGRAVAFASCPAGEDETCHLAFLDVASGAVGVLRARRLAGVRRLRRARADVAPGRRRCGAGRRAAGAAARARRRRRGRDDRRGLAARRRPLAPMRSPPPGRAPAAARHAAASSRARAPRRRARSDTPGSTRVAVGRAVTRQAPSAVRCGSVESSARVGVERLVGRRSRARRQRRPRHGVDRGHRRRRVEELLGGQPRGLDPRVGARRLAEEVQVAARATAPSPCARRRRPARAAARRPARGAEVGAHERVGAGDAREVRADLGEPAGHVERRVVARRRHGDGRIGAGAEPRRHALVEVGGPSGVRARGPCDSSRTSARPGAGR
ncbi:MAG: hypothetical protein U1F43_27425 [Myxococcota bacterium]